MNKKLLAAVIFVVIVGSALGSYFVFMSPQKEEGPIIATDLAEREVTLKKVPAERIVILFNFEEVIAVGGKDMFKKIVGWNRGYWEGRRQWIWEKYKEVFPEIENIPDVGYPYKGTFSVEKVISLQPDVVITYIGELERLETAIKQLEQAGIPVIFVDYHSENIENHAKSTLLLGKILGKEERAQEIVDFYKEQVNKVYSRLKEIDKSKPKVYVEGYWHKWKTYGNCMWGATIGRCGGINIAKGLFERWGEISPEYVLEANPDIIIVTTHAKYELKLGYYADPEKSDQRKEALENWIDRPGWENLNAVKNNRIYAIHHGLSRHIYDFVAVQCFAKWFYPEEFKELDPMKNFKEFHERFLPVDYSGVWWVSLEDC